jgi:endonuclease-3
MSKTVKSHCNHSTCVEMARSSRSICRKCYLHIGRTELRVGHIKYSPYRQCMWYHLDCSGNITAGGNALEIKGFHALDIAQQQKILETMKSSVVKLRSSVLSCITGELDMPMFADALSERYGKFRSFRFGLPSNQIHTNNWKWRCFLATMLVCNTHERAMLKVTGQLFRVYETPEQLDAIRTDNVAKAAWKQWMDSRDLRHAGKKINYILNANRIIIEEHDGLVPNDRATLLEFPGVGRHVSSVTMAWVHNAPEFGVDIHVRRIMERWGFIHSKDPEKLIEAKVKSIIRTDKIGKFSRSFVDHGQSVCGYTPNCPECHLRFSCPTGSKNLDW